MPADPQVGDAFRSENVTGVVFEELTVKAIDKTVAGPRGPVTGAVIMEELHLDGSVSGKVFAPGHGEFDSSHGNDVEALALAVPADAIDEVVPVELRLMSTSAWGILENARLEDWEAANPTLKRMKTLGKKLQANDYPPRIVATMNLALQVLKSAVTGKDVAATSQAVDVARSALDLELLYRGNVEPDRFHLHTQQLRVHAAAKDLAGVAGEVAVLEWIRDRLAPSLSEPQLADLNTELRALRGASSARNASPPPISPPVLRPNSAAVNPLPFATRIRRRTGSRKTTEETAMILLAATSNVRSKNAVHGFRKGLAIREPHGDVKEPGRPRRRRRGHTPHRSAHGRPPWTRNWISSCPMPRAHKKRLRHRRTGT